MAKKNLINWRSERLARVISKRKRPVGLLITNNNHYKDCTKPEVYAIPSTAEVPRKRASKRTWGIFKKQFVFSKPNGWWFWLEKSWWYKNQNKDE